MFDTLDTAFIILCVALTCTLERYVGLIYTNDIVVFVLVMCQKHAQIIDYEVTTRNTVSSIHEIFVTVILSTPLRFSIPILILVHICVGIRARS